MSDSIVIVAAKRTPIGGLLGVFKDLSCAMLGGEAIKAALESAKISPDHIDEVFMGCVLSGGQGQAPARQATLAAGLPNSVGATTINKMCGSGMKSVMLAHDLLQGSAHRMIVAGGMESMTQAPYLLSKARAGYRLGHGQIVDHMFLDGLEDAYDRGRLMGYFAEQTAKKYNFSREAQDEFALRSLARAQEAIQKGKFKSEIAAVRIQDKKGDTVIDTDEQPGSARPDKIPTLKPAFANDGTVTAANSSSISDGAAALVLTTERYAKAQGLKPLARIIAHRTHSHEPAWFTTAPVQAIKNVAEAAKWSLSSVDLFEINEAFAVVTMAAMHDLDLSPDNVNIHGGACALGHPIGCSGARVLVTLLHALQQQGKTRGIAALCIGGGEATAMAIERLS